MARWLSILTLAVVLAACSTDSDVKPGPDSGTEPVTADGGQRRDAARPPGPDAAIDDPCADLDCEAPASCRVSDGDASCVCPPGYELSSNGRACDDVDECSDGTAGCDDHATCENLPGDFRCTCDTPVWTGNGTSCHCAEGWVAREGECFVIKGRECDDDAECATGNCVSGICCASPCTSPGTCQTSDGATCADGDTCSYPTAEDGTACDDGDACTDDSCQAGACTGTPKDCDDGRVCTVNACDPATGCTTDASALNGVTCDDGNPCTLLDACDAGFCLGNERDCSDGEQCTEDTCDTSDGSCMHTELTGDACEDGDPCTLGDTCDAGSCTSGTPNTCNDDNPCTDDACNPSSGLCTNVNNTLGCDDNMSCTVNDSCSGGECHGTESCGQLDDQCNVGACGAGGDCAAVAVQDGTGCDDDDPCTAGDDCGGGVCAGANPACGANSTGCMDCRDDTSGNPVCATDDRICVCNDLFAQVDGVCIASTDDCLLTPCGLNTDCVDNDGTVGVGQVCTCQNGYEGTDPAGAGCTDIDECAGNPCGMGSCIQDAPGAGYHCACDPGYTEVLGACTCDLNGTFAIEITTDLSWPGLQDLIEAGSATVKSWALRQHVYDDQGQLTVTTIPCGGTSPDLCTYAISGYKADESHNQYQPDSIFDLPTMPTEMVQMSVPDATAGQPFVTGETAAFQGIRLTDPTGPWPSSRCEVRPILPSDGCADPPPAQVNGATWVDHDGDSLRGVTSLIVPPGSLPEPVCPRMDTGGPWPYEWLPGAPEGGILITRIKRLWLGSRLLSYLDGTIGACGVDGVQQITGDVKGSGPNAQFTSDARFVGCERLDSTGTMDEPCGPTLVNFLDTQDQTQEITGSTFVIDRIADATSCSAVWDHFGRTGWPPTPP